MSPTRRKRAKAKAKEKVKMSRQENVLIRGGLIKAARLKDNHRKKLAKLTLAEARTLVRVRRKLGYRGSMLIRTFIF